MGFTVATLRDARHVSFGCCQGTADCCLPYRISRENLHIETTHQVTQGNRKRSISTSSSTQNSEQNQALDLLATKMLALASLHKASSNSHSKYPPADMQLMKPMTGTFSSQQGRMLPRQQIMIGSISSLRRIGIVRVQNVFIGPTMGQYLRLDSFAWPISSQSPT